MLSAVTVLMDLSKLSIVAVDRNVDKLLGEHKVAKATRWFCKVLSTITQTSEFELFEHAR